MAYLSKDNKKTVIHSTGICTRIFWCCPMKLNLHTNTQNSITARMKAESICNDPDIGIDWPLDGINEIILSDKDKK